MIKTIKQRVFSYSKTNVFKTDKTNFMWSSDK